MRYWKGLTAISSLSCLCALGAPAGAALAQTTAGGTAAAASGALQEVVVTAERRATNVQTTPISIVAISGAQLQTEQLNTVMDLQKTVPNFQALTAGPYQSLNIRGIGNTAITPSIVPGIAVTHDGLLSDETIFINNPFYDIHDVEVLRGPQGTLVGASSTGGAVEITSENPNFRGEGGYGEVLFGNYNDKKVDGAINMPISSTLAARLAFNWETRHSFYKSKVFLPGPAHTTGDPGDVNDRDMRIGLLWKPSADFQALFKAELDHGNNHGFAAEPNQYTFPSGAGLPCPDGSPGPICHSLYWAYSTHKPFQLNYNQPYMNGRTIIDRYSLQLDYTLADGIDMRSLTGFQHLDGGDVYQDGDVSAAAADLYTKDVGPNDNYYSQEFDFISPTTGKVSWVAGLWAFYRDTDVEVWTLTAFPGVDPILSATTSLGTIPVGSGGTQQVRVAIDSVQRSYAAFGNVDWNFAPTWQLQAGLRGNWDYNFGTEPSNWFPGAPKNTAIAIQIPSATGTCPGFVNQYNCIFLSNNAYEHDAVPTGKIDLNWTPIKGQYLYAFWARGYKSGGVVRGTANGFKPEKVDDYEIGWKSTDFGGRLQTSIGGYWMSYHNMQLQVVNLKTGGFGAVSNIPSPSTIRGIEMSAQTRLGGFGANLSLTINNSKLGAVTEVARYRLPSSANNLPQCTAGVSPPYCFDYTPFFVHLSSEQNPYTPKITGNLTLNYTFQVGSASTLMPQISFTYTGHQFDQIYQDSNYFLLTARHLLNLSLVYGSGPWTVQAFCNNCANEVYVAGAGGVAQGDVWYYGAPRQFGVRINRTFH